MAANSLTELLEIMKTGPKTQGWAAIAVFNRGRINQLLEQQYTNRFGSMDFLPLFSGEIKRAAGQNDVVRLKDVAFGAPRLSFANASLRDGKAVLTMDFLSGRCVTTRQEPGRGTVLLSDVSILQSQGSTIEVEVDLTSLQGAVDRQGKVTVNLSAGGGVLCNLVGVDAQTNTLLGDMFKQQFYDLPANRSAFHISMVDFKGYKQLTPKSFRIVTQPAPGATVRDAKNYGDGNVLLLASVLGQTTPGKFPLDADLPFFIPSDANAGGDLLYPAVLILAEPLIGRMEGNEMEMLTNLLFPEGNRFQEVVRHTPRDLAVFGQISATSESIALSPAYSAIKAGGTQQFTLTKGDGQVVQTSNWTAVSLASHSPERHGKVTAGTYTAPARALVGHDRLHVVVTAEYVDGGVTRTASALVDVLFDSMTTSPQLSTVSAFDGQPVALQALTLDAVPVTWKLLTPEYGTLKQTDSQALFTVDARGKNKSLLVQQAQATGSESGQAAILIVNGQQQVRMEPSYVPRLKASEVVQLKDDITLLPGQRRRWKVIAGGGTVDADGRYAAPAQGATGSVVVQCEIVLNGVVFSSGYSVILLSQMDDEPHWEDLDLFIIELPGGLEGNRMGSVFNNGHQQLRAVITVQTTPINNVQYPLNAYEQASMRLVDDSSKQNVEPLPDSLEGMPDDDPQLWRTRNIPNRFELAPPRGAGSALPDDVPQAADTMFRYIHTRQRANLTGTFFAKFQAEFSHEWFDSTQASQPNSRIYVTPNPQPTYIDDDYKVSRTRVDGGSGGPGPGENEDDDFDFHPITEDYWKFEYVGRPGMPGTAFETLEFLPVNGLTNTSMVRWESEQLYERYCSWTGWYFEESRQGSTRKIKFDEVTKNVIEGLSLDIDVKNVFEVGKLLITLHRDKRVNYVRPTNPERIKLSRPLVLKLVDKRGNPHFMQIDFLPPSIVGHRNRLVRTLYTPPTTE
ncbi:hypothetical protein [Pseudomonas sp. S2_E01]